jgi:two-component system, NarL family, response regulator NreC
MTSVVVVDDHPIVREGLRQLLRAHTEFTIVGEAAFGLDALELVETLHPELAIVDLLLPDLNGMEVIRRMRRASPRTRVVALSMYSDDLHVVEALRVGVIGYIIKGASPETTLVALREALAGRRYLSPPLTDHSIDVYASHLDTAPAKADRYDLLTAREREVLELLARGMTYAEIADKLTISPRTAETHRTKSILSGSNWAALSLFPTWDAERRNGSARRWGSSTRHNGSHSFRLDLRNRLADQVATIYVPSVSGRTAGGSPSASSGVTCSSVGAASTGGDCEIAGGMPTGSLIAPPTDSLPVTITPSTPSGPMPEIAVASSTGFTTSASPASLTLTTRPSTSCSGVGSCLSVVGRLALRSARSLV